MQFFDSVEGGHEELSKTARQIFQHCQTVAVLKAGALPASVFGQGWHQRYPWSCGFHAARILEVRRRQLRGELPAPVLDVANYLAHTRELVAKLQALQAKYKKVPWPPEKLARAPEVSKDTDPGDKSEAGQEKEEDPGDKDPDAAGKDSKLVKGSLEEALARAIKCTSCKPRKTGPFEGSKGCKKCMGEHFETMRSRTVQKRKADT